MILGVLEFYLRLIESLTNKEGTTAQRVSTFALPVLISCKKGSVSEPHVLNSNESRELQPWRVVQGSQRRV